MQSPMLRRLVSAPDRPRQVDHGDRAGRSGADRHRRRLPRALPAAAAGLVFVEAFRAGVGAYFAGARRARRARAIRLTLLVAAIAVPLNIVFGVAAAWAIAKFEFKGKSLPHHADRPALLGLAGHLGPGLCAACSARRAGSAPGSQANDIEIIFAVPGIVLATIFVTFPFVARELIPLMQEQGTQDEEAALSLGASGWQTFWRVTLPNIKWGLLYGVLLCNARAMGEFGAVSVVSGHIRGLTNTMPLHVEILYNEYNFAAAFAVASLLALLALVTLARQDRRSNGATATRSPARADTRGRKCHGRSRTK